MERGSSSAKAPVENPSSGAFAGFIIEWGDASFVEVGDGVVKVLAQVGKM